ncbi:ABC transporter substrate-binding protein [Cohnella terricola]|uniref:Extracellular solute-binding protein n=1 Tax=Cohnella terricola TaxID=1289167 RepID=A0A559JGV0_9BACL|nr:extracellular solute-binding protein [Cohnella terricola]TVX99104.1 extracellular solute-binding protein [Cohnella terricola]
MKRKFMIGWIGIAVLLSTQACTKVEKIKEPVTLKVWSWEGNYGDYATDFAGAHEGIRLVRVAPIDETNPMNGYDPEKMKQRFEQTLQAIEELQPDVLLLEIPQYIKLAREGKLASLEQRVKRKDFNEATYSPSLLTMLRIQGSDELYGLADNLYSEAIYYNKTLLNKNQIPLPQSSMSWEETLRLADRVSNTNAGIAGYFAGTDERTRAWAIISGIGMTSKLQYVNAKDKIVTIHTPAWAKIWQMVLDGYKSGAIIENTQEMSVNRGGHNYYKPEDSYGLFLSGKAAMIKASPGFKDILSEQKVGFEWGVVAEPSDPTLKEGISMQPLNIYAISAASPYKDEAWQLIDYLISEERQKRQAAAVMSMGGLPARIDANQGEDSFIKPFVELPPSPEGQFVEFYRDDIPNSFIDSFSLLADAYFLKLLDGTLSVDEALKQLQEEAQAEFNKFK